jgi:hypothetical protein
MQLAVNSGSGIDRDLFQNVKNPKIHGIRHKIQTGKAIRMKYAPKEPQNQAEFERFSLTTHSGQPFGREIEKKYEQQPKINDQGAKV